MYDPNLFDTTVFEAMIKAICFTVAIGYGYVLYKLIQGDGDEHTSND